MWLGRLLRQLFLKQVVRSWRQQQLKALQSVEVHPILIGSSPPPSQVTRLMALPVLAARN
jgi:hypothetical protein